jgi:hypothetical protein
MDNFFSLLKTKRTGSKTNGAGDEAGTDAFARSEHFHSAKRSAGKFKSERTSELIGSHWSC